MLLLKYELSAKENLEYETKSDFKAGFSIDML